MTTKIKQAVGLILALASSSVMAITVTTTNDANTLANTIAGSGITISSATYSGGSASSGTFTGDTVFGMGSGIVLTTGSTSTAADTVNNSDSTSVNSGTGGDADLSNLIGGATTYNATVLEFDFTSTGGDLFFNFAFASEEYNEYVNSQFNDVFAFFVNGVNIALAPNGAVASINSINCGNPYTGIGPNCSSYNNNDLNDGGPFYATEYDGFTDVLTAEALGLGAGTQHIKIAIADTSDASWDSAVFIQGGTFSDTPTSVPEPAVLTLLGLGLAGMTITRRRKLAA